MRRILGLWGLAILVAAGGLGGCHKPAVREKPLPDPLLTSKKPIEGRPLVAEIGSCLREEWPPPPPLPALERGSMPVAQEVPLVQLLGPRAVH